MTIGYDLDIYPGQLSSGNEENVTYLNKVKQLLSLMMNDILLWNHLKYYLFISRWFQMNKCTNEEIIYKKENWIIFMKKSTMLYATW